MNSQGDAGLHLVTGATGYVGGKLARHLLDQGRDVRVLVRDPDRLPDSLRGDVDVAVGSVDDGDALASALDGVRVAYYLVHAMSDGDDFVTQDRRLAESFAAAADTARADGGTLERLVYLGGLWPRDEPLTEHLASRKEVGDILLATSVPTAVLQAGIVVGPGSASYDMLSLAARLLPVVTGPSWLHHRVQPISLADLLVHLEAAADLPADVDRAFDVGGTEAVTYAELVRACQRSLGKRAAPVITWPVLLPHTLSELAGTFAPGPSSLNAALVHSLSVDMVMDEDDFAAYLPAGHERDDVRTALAHALDG